MRAAPPVSVRCSGGWLWRAVQTGLVGWASAAFAVWCLQQVERPIVWAAPVALLMAALTWRLARPRTVDLVWDGQRWTANGIAGRLEVVFDLGAFLLLRLRPDAASGVRWIPLTRAEAGASMHGLRVAAYSRVPQADASATTPNGDQR